MKNYDKGLSFLQLIDRKKFDELVEKWGLDSHVRTFKSWKHVCVLVLSYIMKLDTTREVEGVFKIPRSTFNDANCDRSSGFFEDLCKLVLWQIHDKSKKRKVRKAIRTLLAIDSTECSVHGSIGKNKKWRARSGGTKAKVKIHVVWNVDDEWIADFKITPGRSADMTVGKEFKTQSGKTYVFDRAYNDLGFWYKIMNNSSHFVTRLKDCCRRRIDKFIKIKKEDARVGILWEGKWKPSQPTLKKHPEVPKNLELRHIVYRDPKSKKVFDFVTSDWKATGQAIADIYKKRWAVELFFRWLKGHLKIRTFSAKTSNAIEVFATTAILVQLLIRLYKDVNKFKDTLWAILREIRTQISLHGLESLFRELFSPEAPNVKAPAS